MRALIESAKLPRHPSLVNHMIRNLAEKLLEELQQFGPSVDLLPKRELHLALQAALGRLDLVTREEFDAQAAVLARTRQKLEELERQLALLEP